MNRPQTIVRTGLLLLILSCLSSCHDDLMEQAPAHGDALTLRAEIDQQYTTRASDGGFADGDKIGVFIVNYQDGEPVELQATGNHADNVLFTYDEATGQWSGSYQLYWKDKLTPIDAYGYYPFDAELSSVSHYPFTVQPNQDTHSVEGRQLTGYEASDFLWAKKEGVLPTDGAITLRHRHIMAGVKIILEEGDGFLPGEWETISKSVLMENIITEGTINLQAGTATASAASEVKVITPLTTVEGREYRICLYPQTVAAGKRLFSFTIDGQSMEFARQEAMNIQPGKQHLFTFAVNKSLPKGDYQLALTGESVTPWDSDPVSHDGAAREYITVNIEEGEYLGDVISRMGIDPKEIINLKLTGTMSGLDGWESSPQFDYIRENITNLEAINMKGLRTKEMRSVRWESGWGAIPYGQKEFEDDFIPMFAFAGMQTLSYVTWPDSLKGIAGGAFGGTGLRGSLILPDGLRFIGADAFCLYGQPSTNLTGELYIPSTVEYIGDMAFGNYDSYDRCFFRDELVLPARMKYLGSGAFAGCPYLTGTIRIPEGLDVINNFCAPNMTAKVLRIPQGVKKVNGLGGQPASIIFPEGVEEINSLFGGSSQPWGPLDQRRKSLRSIKLPNTLRRLGEWAFAGTGITHLSIPEGIEYIPYYAFGQCNYLQDTVVIPSTVQQIHEQAFFACEKLNAVVLPEKLNEIRDFAFCGCRSLYYIRCMNPEPPAISGSAFDGVEKNECALVVPEGAEEAYRQAEGWREFKRISTYQNFVCRPMHAKLLNNGNTRTIVLNSDGNWQVTHCPDWVHPSKTSGFKKTELTVKIDAMAHGNGDRRDSIVFTLTDKTAANGDPITCYYGIEQFDYEYDEDSQMQLQKATQGKGVNIVFLGDGYDAEDIAIGRFLEDVKEGMEYFFAVEPYKTYQGYFNVYANMAMSFESGVCSSVDMWRDTKFSTIFGAGDNGRLSVNADEVMSYVLQDVAASAVTEQNVDRSLVVCVLHSDAYEGITAMYDSGAAVAFVPHSRQDYPNDYRGLMQHEAGGHGFGKLGDEYIYHRANIFSCSCMCCAHVDAVLSAKAKGWFRNLSLDGRYSTNEWRHLIFHPQYGDIVDLYEGGHMHSKGIYRPETNSCMNNNVPYYNSPSRQAIVERIMEYAGQSFNFDEFVAHDSREMGDKFLTRSVGSHADVPTAMHGHGPVIISGSPLDYISKKGGKR